MNNNQEQPVMVNFGTYIMVWLTLLLFTGLTVTVAGMNLREFAIVAAILIAAIKSSLVLNYFMHLKYESAFFRNLVFVVIFTLAIIIGLTFTDISFR